MIRQARKSDAEAIASIYAPFVKDTAVTFEVEVPDAAAFERRIETVLENYPYLAAEVEGRVVAYAYAGRQMERSAYQWNAVLSVYLGGHRGRGLGTALYSALIDLLKLQNIHNVYGGVTWPNPASEALHLKLGFSILGRYRRTGFKNGCWHDVVWFEKRIMESEGGADGLGHIPPFIPFRALAPELVASALNRFNLTPGRGDGPPQ